MCVYNVQERFLYSSELRKQDAESFIFLNERILGWFATHLGLWVAEQVEGREIWHVLEAA